MSKRLGTVIALLLITMVVAACGGGRRLRQSTLRRPRQLVKLVLVLFAHRYSGSRSSARSLRTIPDLTVKRGQPSRSSSRTRAPVPHDLLIDEFSVNSGQVDVRTIHHSPVHAQPGGPVQIYCAEPGHEAAGMVATLVVE